MKLTKILLSGAVALTPSVVLPLINAAKANDTHNAYNNEVKRAKSNNVIVVPADGWVTIEESSRYHVTFNDSGSDKTCTIDHIEIYSDLTMTLAAEYKSEAYPSAGNFKLTKIDTLYNTAGGGTIKSLILSNAKYLEEISDRAFDRVSESKDIACTFKLNWVDFSGAERLREIGEKAFRNQFFDRNDTNLDMDFSNTSLQTIGAYAFAGCCSAGSKNKTIRSIIFSTDLSYMGANAFDTWKNNENNLAAKRLVFLGEHVPACWGQKCLPNIDEAVKDTACIYVPYQMKDHYWDSFQTHLSEKAGIGVLIRELNLRESTIKFNTNQGEPGIGTLYPHLPAGKAGVDKKGNWYPVNVTTGEKVEGAKVWLTDDLGGTVHFNRQPNDEYQLSWDANIPVGEHILTIMAVTGSSTTFSMAYKTVYFTVNEVSLSGGSNIVYANHITGEDTKKWLPRLSHDELEITKDVEWKVSSSNPNVESVVHVKQSNDAKHYGILYWDNNTLEDGWYDVRITATFYGDSMDKYTASAAVRFFIGSTYYDIDITDPTTREYPVDHIKIPKNTPKTFEMQCSAGGQAAEFIWSPYLSIKSDAITKAKVSGSTGKYTITINPDKLAIGTYELYTYTYVYLPRANKDDIKYPIYSNSIIFDITPNATEPQIPTCTGGTSELESYYKQAGKDEQSWKLSTYTKYERQYSGTISNLKLTKTEWSPISDERMKHVYAVMDSSQQGQFHIEWDSDFTTLVKQWETAEFNVEFDAIYSDLPDNTTTFTSHTVVPISVSIWNYGEVKSDAGQNLYGYPNKAVDVEKPWLMYCNNATTPVSTQVDYYLVEDEDFPEAQSGKITLKTHEGEVNSAYLSYLGLPEGTYGFYIYGYDEENVTTAYQHIVLRIANVAAIDGLPESLVINKGDGKYDTPITTYLNGEVYTGKVTYTLENVDNDKMWIDEQGYLCWSSKLDVGAYDPMIYASITVDGTTLYTLPIYITVSVNQVITTGPNIGAIVGGSVGGAVGAAGIGTGTYFGVKKYKAVKGKK